MSIHCTAVTVKIRTLYFRQNAGVKITSTV